MTCPICCEAYSKAVRKQISCLYCTYSACIKCQQQYLLTVRESQCMNCHVEWNREFIDHAFSKVFRTKTLKTHREQILLDVERAMLPDTMPYVEWEIQREKDRALIRHYRAEITRLRQEVDRLEFRQRLVHPPDAYFRGAQGGIEEGEGEGDTGGASTSSQAAPKPKFKTVHACPSSDCRGFLDAKWTCGLCQTRVCGTCRETLVTQTQGDGGGGEGGVDQPHVCKPELVATAKLLDKDTKSCPNCNVLIHRVSGCNQMWCTACQTAFDWRTGCIETKHIHNPHYTEWLRRTRGLHAADPVDPVDPIDPLADLPIQMQPDCNALIIPSSQSVQMMVTNTTRWANAMCPKSKIKPDSILTMAQAHQALMHLYRVIFLNMRDEWNVYQRMAADARNRDLRIAFLRNKITEVQMQRTLQQREKKRAQQHAFVQLMQMFLQTGGEAIERVTQESRRWQQGNANKVPPPYVCKDILTALSSACNKSLLELDTLRTYFNDQMDSICDRFQCKAPIGTLMKDWRWATV